MEKVIVKCPLCKRRVMDIETEQAVLYIKCPHCRTEHRIVLKSGKAA